MPRAVEVDRAGGKRKAPQIQATITHRGESKTTLSYHNKSIDGKGPNRNRLRANHRQKAKVIVGTQKNGMGLGKEKDMFVFGATAGPSKVNGLGQSPFPFSNASNSKVR